MYIDDMMIDFDFENQIRNMGRCENFTDIDESSWDYLDNSYDNGYNEEEDYEW